MTTSRSAGAGPQRAAASDWPRVVVFGAGAVGCFYGAKLAEAGAPVTLVARAAHVDAIRAAGLLFESGGERRRIAIDATTDPDVLREADLALFCVKTRDTEEGARIVAPRLRPGAIVASLQNGVDNVERMRAAAGLDPLAAVVYVATAMGGPGHLVHSGRGDLVLGEVAGGAGSDPGRAERVAAWFERAGVPCPVSADVRAALWTKLAMNCVYNAISGLARARYGRILGEPLARETMRDLVAECVAVARADGVDLGDEAALFASAVRLGEAMSGQFSSTAQDLMAGKPTEIDALNGHVVRRGAALGVPAPVNRTMVALVRLLESAPAEASPGV